MIFGDRAVFAIECAVEPERENGYRWGTVCYHVGGVQCGDLSGEPDWLDAFGDLIEYNAIGLSDAASHLDTTGTRCEMVMKIHDHIYSDRIPKTDRVRSFSSLVIAPTNSRSLDGQFVVTVPEGNSIRVLAVLPDRVGELDANQLRDEDVIERRVDKNIYFDLLRRVVEFCRR